MEPKWPMPMRFVSVVEGHPEPSLSGNMTIAGCLGGLLRDALKALDMIGPASGACLQRPQG